MATITKLDFAISSNWDGSGVRAAQADVRLLNEDLRRLSGRHIRVNVDAEIDGKFPADFQQRINAQAQAHDYHVPIRVELQDAAARARIAELTRNRRVRIDIDTNASGSHASADSLMDKLRIMQTLGRLAGIAVAGIAASFFLIGPAAAVAGALVMASLGGALIAVAAISQMANDKMTAATNKATQAAQMQADTARNNLASAYRNVGQTAEQGARQIESAERGVASAQRASKSAQLDLNRARKDAKQDLDDINRALGRMALDEEGAALAVANARRTLMEAGSDPLDRANAQHSLNVALLDEQEVLTDSARLQREAAEANKNGVEGSTRVVDAKERVAEAARGEREAEENLQKARSDAAAANVRALEDVAAAQQEVTRAQSELNDELAKGNDLLHQTVKFLAEMTAPMRGPLSDAATKLKEKFGQLMPQIQDTFRNAAPLIQPFADSLTGFVSNILPGMNDGLKNSGPIIAGFRDGMGSLGTHFGNTFAEMGKGAEGLGRVWVITGNQFGAFVERIGKGAGEMAQTGATSWDKMLGGINNLVDGIMDGATPAMEAMAGGTSVWFSIFSGIGTIFREAGPAIGQFTEALSGVLGPAIDSLAPAIGGISGAMLSSLVPALNAAAPLIKSLADGIASVLGWLEPIMPVLGPVIAGVWALHKAFLAYKAAVIAIAGAHAIANARLSVSAAMTATHTVATRAAAAAQGLWTAAVWLWNAAVGAVGIALLTARVVAHTIATKAVAVAQGIWTAAVWLWNAAVGAVGIAALTATVVAHGIATKAVAVAQGIWTAAQWLLNAALTANPIGIVVVAVGALVAAIIWIATKTTWFQTAWKYTWNFVKEVALAVWNWLKDQWTDFLNKIESAWNTVSGAVMAAWDLWWNTVKSVAQAIWDWITDQWNDFLTGIKVIWDTVSSVISAAWELWWNTVKSVAQAIWDAISGAWNFWLDGIKKVFEIWKDLFFGTWKKLWDGIRNTAETIWKVIQDKFTDFKDGVARTLDGLVTKAKEIWNGIKKVFADPINFVIGIWNDNVSGKFGLPSMDPIGGFAGGGPIYGKGGPTEDSNLARLSRGEHVWTAAEVDGVGGHRVVESLRAGALRPDTSRLAAFALGGEVDTSLWNAVSGAFPNASLNSAYRPGDSGFHGKASAVDVGGPMQQIADWIAGRYPQIAQQIWDNGPSGYFGNWNQDEVRKIYTESTMAEHRDHVHLAHTSPIANDGTMISAETGSSKPGGISGKIRETLGALFARLTNPLLDSIPDPVPGLGDMLGKFPKSAATKIRDGFRDKIEGVEKVAGVTTGDMAGVGGIIPEGDHLRIINDALNATKTPPPNTIQAWQAGLNTLIERESGWNAGAVNDWDSNAKNGTPSKGLAQTIQTTFDAHHQAGTSNNIFDPVANVSAAVNYIKSRYGDIANVQQANANMAPQGYAEGTRNAKPGWALVGERGPEAVKFRGGEEVHTFDEIITRLKDAASSTGLQKKAEKAGGDFVSANVDQFLGDIGAGGIGDGFFPQLLKQGISYGQKLHEQNIHYHVTDIDEALRKEKQRRREQSMGFGG